jgi:hypothetical protein
VSKNKGECSKTQGAWIQSKQGKALDSKGIQELRMLGCTKMQAKAV